MVKFGWLGFLGAFFLMPTGFANSEFCAPSDVTDEYYIDMANQRIDAKVGKTLKNEIKHHRDMLLSSKHIALSTAQQFDFRKNRRRKIQIYQPIIQDKSISLWLTPDKTLEVDFPPSIKADDIVFALIWVDRLYRTCITKTMPEDWADAYNQYPDIARTEARLITCLETGECKWARTEVQTDIMPLIHLDRDIKLTLIDIYNAAAQKWDMPEWVL